MAIAETPSEVHSGVLGSGPFLSCGRQRRRYDQRRRDVLAARNIWLIEVEYQFFQCNGQKRLRRNAMEDDAVIREKLSAFLPPAGR